MSQAHASVVNLLPTIAPKSDQLNADDLIGRTMTIRVSRVTLCGEPDQPIAIHFEGDDGKPYKPCKSMRRVLVHVWGGDGNAYPGRRMTLYRDDRVQFGGMAVGGIRISHMSHIDREMVMALTATRAKRAPYTVKPLPAERGAEPVQELDMLSILTAGRAAAAKGTAALTAWWGTLGKPAQMATKPTLDSELKAAAAKADQRPRDADGGVPFDDPPPTDTASDFPGDAPAETKPDLPPMKTGADLLAEQEATKPTLAERVADFKAKCAGKGTADLQKAWRLSSVLRSDLDASDPEAVAELTDWWQAAFNAAETSEKGGV